MSNGRFSCCVCHQKWSLLIFEPLTLENQTGDLSLWTLWDVCCIQRYKWAGQKLLFETDCIQGGQNSETFYFFIWEIIFGSFQSPYDLIDELLLCHKLLYNGLIPQGHRLKSNGGMRRQSFHVKWSIFMLRLSLEMVIAHF